MLGHLIQQKNFGRVAGRKLSLIHISGMAYEHDFRFLQLAIGYLVGRALICVLLIPSYFRGQLVTAYQLIERRFGQRLRGLTARCV